MISTEDRSEDWFDHAERQCERIFVQFESQWREGTRPRIADYLPLVDEAERQDVLVELVFIDLERAIKAGHSSKVEDYLNEFAELCEDDSVILDLLAWELRTRRAQGELAAPEEYFRRFPSLHELLAARIASESEADEDNCVRPSRSHLSDMPVLDESRGNLQILEEIARGGMGMVLRGHDPSLGRELAVKVLLDTHRDRPELVARFVEEARISGQLQHPGIVPIYGLGTFTDRRPYFSMKLVKGRTLAALLSGRNVELPRLLSIFEAVSQTVAYAHAQGVIHRDLKPANVMVGSFGEVQVMDWGLAKVLCRAGAVGNGTADEAASSEPEVVIATIRESAGGALSRPGAIMGTLPYMAPEQARGEVERLDERADVFALGSILCEILTGKPAFLGPSGDEILRQAERADLTDAIHRLDACGADLALIALSKDALAPAKEDRPGNAGIVSQRITAYLIGVQEQLRAAERARAAQEARTAEAESRVKAEIRARRMTASLAASVLLAGVLGTAGWRWVERERIGRAAALSARINAALQEVTRLRGQAQVAAAGDLRSWIETVSAAQNVRLLLEPGVDPALRQQVDRLLKAVTAERQRVEETLAGAERDRVLLDRVDDIRSLLGDDPDGSASEAAYAEAFRDAEIDIATLPVNTAGAKIRARPPAVAMALVAALENWAAVRRSWRNDRTGADRLYQIVHVIGNDPWRQRLHSAHSHENKQMRLTFLKDLAQKERLDRLSAVNLDQLGRDLSENGDLKTAESVLRTAQRLYPRDAWVNYDLAQVLEKQSRRNEAIRYYTAARAIRPETAHELAHALVENGEDNEAIAIFAELTRIRPDVARHLVCFGTALKAQGRSQESTTVFVAAVNLIRKSPRNPLDVHNRINLARALDSLGNTDEAIAEYRGAIRLNPRNAMAHYNLGVILCDKKEEYDASIKLFRKAIHLDPDDPLPRFNLGTALKKKGLLDEAALEYRAAMRLKPDHPGIQRNLGAVLADLGMLSEAATVFREAIHNNIYDRIAHYNLGYTLHRQEKDDEAITELKEAIRLDPALAKAHIVHGDVLSQQRKFDEAINAYREAVRLEPDRADTHHSLGNALRGYPGIRNYCNLLPNQETRNKATRRSISGCVSLTPPT